MSVLLFKTLAQKVMLSLKHNYESIVNCFVVMNKFYNYFIIISNTLIICNKNYKILDQL
jgi:hypothetical protein